MATPYLDPPRGDAAPRLFCFHHAGGGASLFQHWQRGLSPNASVWPVLLPGRERRMHEPRFVSIEPLVAELDEHLGPYLTEPHVFFGHSMGALVAYRLACLRRSRGEPLPRALVLSGYSAPHLPSPFPPVDHLDDDQLAQLIAGIGGLDVDLPVQWRTALLAVTRDDLRLCASHTEAGEPPLPVPLHLFGADADPLVDADDLQQWERYTTGSIDVQILPGGHFSLRDAPEALLAQLRPLLRRYAVLSP